MKKLIFIAVAAILIASGLPGAAFAGRPCDAGAAADTLKVNTTALAGDVEGFNGPTPLVIALDADGRIKDVALLENQETTWYAQHVKEGGLYTEWNGLTPAEALEKDVDAISGATYTSNGVKNSLIARLKAYQKQVK